MQTNSIPSADAQPGDEAEQINKAPDAETPATVMEPAAEPTERELVEAERAHGRRWTALIPTILVGVLMFVLGGVGGFLGRPYIMPPSPTPTQSAAQQQQTRMQALLDMLISKTRHFKGNANAPVTLLEFGDFQ